MPMVSVTLASIIREFHLETAVPCGKPEEIRIGVSDLTRPGLQLAGYFDHFGPDRIQVIGNMETAFLERLTPRERRARLEALFATGIPCLILTRSHEVSPELEAVAR